MPEVSEDKKSLTLVYDTPYVDWNLQWLLDQDGNPLPIHVVAEKAGVTAEEFIEAMQSHPAGRPRGSGRAERDDQGRRATSGTPAST